MFEQGADEQSPVVRELDIPVLHGLRSVRRRVERANEDRVILFVDFRDRVSKDCYLLSASEVVAIRAGALPC